MFGKSFESKYEGSMYGKGVLHFAVWDYVIAKAKCSRVELNPKVMANIFGDVTVERVAEEIERLCQPDPESRNKEKEGRKLIKEGEFQYFVTGWEKYQAIRNEVDRRESNRASKRRERQRAKGEDVPRRRAGRRIMDKSLEQAIKDMQAERGTGGGREAEEVVEAFENLPEKQQTINHGER